MRNYSVIFAGILCILWTINADRPCIPKKFNHSSVVCVCNSTYFDDISKVTPLNRGNYALYTSTMSGKRFEKTTGSFNDYTSSENKYFDAFNNYYGRNDGSTILKIDRKRTFQTIFGFGGAFTDAVGINMLGLSRKTQHNIMKSYFSENGLEYNMGRVPIGGCDFSTHAYAYNMKPKNDATLSNFSLTFEDYDYKIPYIKEAIKMANEDILLVASAWSPPPWMKTNDAFTGLSRLIEKYYQTWADYHLKFIQQYYENGITIWAITTGNEPLNGVIPISIINSLGWTPTEQGRWVAENLGPTIKNSNFPNVQILTSDDQRITLPWWIDLMAKVDGAISYINGIAVHWYLDDFVSASVVDSTKANYPDKYVISTEACVGDRPWEFEKVELGSWKRGERYLHDIIKNMNNWYSSWIDWNLVLSRTGGPNWVENFVDAPIIAIPENDEFYKQPLYYAIGHISKFVPRNSKRIFSKRSRSDVEFAAFLRPDDGIAVVFNNPTNKIVNIVIKEEGRANLEITAEANSFNTLVYW